jgi:hypothetical protein
MYFYIIRKDFWGPNSVADPGCLSRILDPDFDPSCIPGPGIRIQQQQQKRRREKFVVLPFFVVSNFVTKLPKIWAGDPGSGKNLFRIPDLRGKNTGSRIRNTGS